MVLTTISRTSLAALALAAAIALASPPARAQGTEEQQEACAPDAFKLCQATIPDVPKTAACMKAHFAQLSPRCKVVFNEATGGDQADAPATARGEAVSPPADAAPEEDAATPERVPGLHSYEAQIRGYCRQGLIDPFTCRNTLDALHGIE